MKKQKTQGSHRCSIGTLRPGDVNSHVLQRWANTQTALLGHCNTLATTYDAMQRGWGSPARWFQQAFLHHSKSKFLRKQGISNLLLFPSDISNITDCSSFQAQCGKCLHLFCSCRYLAEPSNSGTFRWTFLFGTMSTQLTFHLPQPSNRKHRTAYKLCLGWLLSHLKQ